MQSRARGNGLVDDTPRALIVPGGKDIILEPKDFSSWRSWERLCLGMPVQADDFRDARNYKRYYLLSNSLTTGVLMVGGAEGNGKSLELYWLAWQLRELFGKGCTFDIPPKETFGYSMDYAEQFEWGEARYNPPPERTLGGYRSIDDTSFIEELKKFGEIAKMEKAKEKGDVKGEEFSEALNDVKLFNSVIGIDEAYDRLERARRGNFAVNLGHFIRKYRHYHNLFILVSPDIDDIDKRMAFKRRTHEIHCHKDDVTGKCRYRIWWRKPNRWTAHELTPSRWNFLWETHNVIGGTILAMKKESNTKE
jgi:hypothetical protein